MPKIPNMSIDLLKPSEPTAQVPPPSPERLALEMLATKLGIGLLSHEKKPKTPKWLGDECYREVIRLQRIAEKYERLGAGAEALFELFGLPVRRFW